MALHRHRNVTGTRRSAKGRATAAAAKGRFNRGRAKKAGASVLKPRRGRTNLGGFEESPGLPPPIKGSKRSDAKFTLSPRGRAKARKTLRTTTPKAAARRGGAAGKSGKAKAKAPGQRKKRQVLPEQPPTSRSGPPFIPRTGGTSPTGPGPSLRVSAARKSASRPRTRRRANTRRADAARRPGRRR